VGNRYIYNKHIAPITANARDEQGAVVLTKTFLPERLDGTTGRVISTGYTTLTDEEYDRLCSGSKTFTHYKDKLKLLMLCDDLPPEAKTPQEALADARRKEREAQSMVVALETEITALKAKLLDAETAYKKLVSASTDLEALESLNDQIASLEKDKEAMRIDIENLVKERDQLRADLAKVKKGGDKDFE
jgi:prefoldin subunit 5